MGKRRFLVIALLFLVLLATHAAATQVPLGVKEGDWIEYAISTTGTPPVEHDAVWARMEILEINGNEVKANIKTKTPNGTYLGSIRTFNLETGNVATWIIIPANLSQGDTFYDAYLGRNVTIEGEEERTIAGANRVTTYASIPERHKHWDKATGVFVEALDYMENYTVNATATATNMWTKQAASPDQTALYAAALAVTAVVVVTVAVLVYRRKKH